MSDAVPGLVEHLFRHEAGKLVSGLARRLGAEHFDIAEESVQDALVKALKQWPFQGAPENPAGWLSHVAYNLALDRLRRRATFTRIQSDVAELVRRSTDPPADSEVLDDQLAMMFACCHPALPEDARLALTLKAVCGFSTAEIARAFLTEEPTIAQRIVRAKKRLREEHIAIAVPPPAEIIDRIDSVLRVLYLLFNEGYSATAGDDLVRGDVCYEALRLCRLLTERPDTSPPKAHALVALMFFHASRFDTRVDGSGDLLRLADQDRSKWDRRLIFAGLRHLDKAIAGDEMTTYHLEAGIAAIHAQAESDEATDWPRILGIYDHLVSLVPSPVVKLNRAVAVSRVHGYEAGLAELESLSDELTRYAHLHAVRAEFLTRLDRSAEARESYTAALSCPCNEPERRFLQRQLDQ